MNQSKCQSYQQQKSPKIKFSFIFVVQSWLKIITIDGGNQHINQYYRAIGCLSICHKPISSWTAGPIWLIFLLSPTWSGESFWLKNSGSDIRFFGNPEKSGHFIFYTNFSSEQFRAQKSLESVKPFQSPIAAQPLELKLLVSNNLV